MTDSLLLTDANGGVWRLSVTPQGKLDLQSVPPVEARPAEVEIDTDNLLGGKWLNKAITHIDAAITGAAQKTAPSSPVDGPTQNHPLQGDDHGGSAP